jgi:hypothetical protein
MVTLAAELSSHDHPTRRRSPRSLKKSPLSRSSADVQWRKGWTPWGTPCSVMVVDGFAYAAQAAEKADCPLAHFADS